MMAMGHGRKANKLEGTFFLIGSRKIDIDIRTKNFRKPSIFDRYEGHGRAQRKANILGSPYLLIRNPRMT